jgi:hypothetical protein
MVVDKSCMEVKMFDGRREDVGEAAIKDVDRQMQG